jgi:hypothetical protein
MTLLVQCDRCKDVQTAEALGQAQVVGAAPAPVDPAKGWFVLGLAEGRPPLNLCPGCHARFQEMVVVFRQEGRVQ